MFCRYKNFLLLSTGFNYFFPNEVFAKKVSQDLYLFVDLMLGHPKLSIFTQWDVSESHVTESLKLIPSGALESEYYK